MVATQQHARAQEKPQAASPSPEVARGAGDKGGLKRELTGKSFAEQEAMLAPAAQRPVVAGSSGAAGAQTPATAEPSTAPALGSDAVVLSNDPKWATSIYLIWFRQKVQAKVEGWGLPFEGNAISLAQDGGKQVVALKWNEAWGSRPTTPVLGEKLNPLDAKAAVTGVHRLKGWGTVKADKQGKLDALLGGETNLVSEAARDALRPKFAGLDARPETEQAGTLEGLIGARDATPFLADERVDTKPATFTLGAPSEQPNYEFRGGKGDALIYRAAFDDGTSLTIVAPKAPDPTMHYHSVQEAAEAASYLPHNSRATIHTVVLNSQVNPEDAHWAVQYNTPDFHSYMTAGASGVVTIYPDKTPPPDANSMRGSMIHETGHAWSYQKWGNDKTKGGWATWKAAMDSDGVSVSSYAMNSIAEDVAETVRVYGATKGTPKYDEYQAMIPARLAILARELG